MLTQKFVWLFVLNTASKKLNTFHFKLAQKGKSFFLNIFQNKHFLFQRKIIYVEQAEEGNAEKYLCEFKILWELLFCIQ